jgi:hypothetical protein
MAACFEHYCVDQLPPNSCSLPPFFRIFPAFFWRLIINEYPCRVISSYFFFFFPRRLPKAEGEHHMDLRVLAHGLSA